MQKNKIIEWPSQSPDMNPIENLWAYIYQQLFGFKSKAEMNSKIVEFGIVYPLVYVNNL